MHRGWKGELTAEVDSLVWRKQIAKRLRSASEQTSLKEGMMLVLLCSMLFVGGRSDVFKGWRWDRSRFVVGGLMEKRNKLRTMKRRRCEVDSRCEG